MFPLSWYNLVSLYGAETLIWSGSNRIIDHISADDNPGLWQLTFTISASSGSNVRTKLFTVSSLLVGEALSWMDSVSSQLNLGEIYTVSINYFRVGSNYGSPWPFLIDAVILMPDLSLVSYYNLVSSSVKQSIDQCYSQSRALSSIPLMAGICRQYTFTISLLIYNGSLRK